MKKALVTGALGQDGSYMCEYLLSKGYEVWGTVRKHSMKQEEATYINGVNYRFADMRDTLDLETVIRKSTPDEIYNFAGQVFVPTSWTHPAETFDVNTSGLARILSIVEKVCSHARVYQASSSEMFGNVIMKPRSVGSTTSSLGFTSLSESSPMNPVSPYGVSKYAAHKLVDVYRQKGLYVCSGICFNHESPRRGQEMVTRKITKHIAAVMAGKETETLRLGNPDARRDWGFAGDYIVAMNQMLQQKAPDDYVIGTGEAHSVHEFITAALAHAGLTDDTCKIKYDCQEFKRQNELHCLIANVTKAHDKLRWVAHCTFDHLVKIMVDADYDRIMSIKEDVCIAK